MSKLLHSRSRITETVLVKSVGAAAPPIVPRGRMRPLLGSKDDRTSRHALSMRSSGLPDRAPICRAARARQIAARGRANTAEGGRAATKSAKLAAPAPQETDHARGSHLRTSRRDRE